MKEKLLAALQGSSSETLQNLGFVAQYHDCIPLERQDNDNASVSVSVVSA